jgi:hypothetical protein
VPEYSNGLSTRDVAEGIFKAWLEITRFHEPIIPGHAFESVGNAQEAPFGTGLLEAFVPAKYSDLLETAGVQVLNCVFDDGHGDPLPQRFSSCRVQAPWPQTSSPV